MQITHILADDFKSILLEAQALLKGLQETRLILFFLASATARTAGGSVASEEPGVLGYIQYTYCLKQSFGSPRITDPLGVFSRKNLPTLSVQLCPFSHLTRLLPQFMS